MEDIIDPESLITTLFKYNHVLSGKGEIVNDTNTDNDDDDVVEASNIDLEEQLSDAVAAPSSDALTIGVEDMAQRNTMSHWIEAKHSTPG